MRIAVKLMLAVLVSGVIAGMLPTRGFAAPAATTATPITGLSITPAAITLGLAGGQRQTQMSITIVNQYQIPVALHFAIEPSQLGTLSGASPSAHIHVTPPDVVIGAGARTTQTVSFTDSADLTPGSHTADLVVSFTASSDKPGIGVLPSMRLPVTAIKYDGAVAALGGAVVSSPRISMHLPDEVTVGVRNTGNIIAIPRGTVSVVAPNGTVVGHGVLNGASKALAPGNRLLLKAIITPLAHAVTPGPYTIRAEYGLGGDSPSQYTSRSFMYVAWWHIAVLATLGVGIWCALKQRRRLIRLLSFVHQPSHQSAPKRTLLIGRDIS